MPEIAVIILSYQNEAETLKCVGSILRSTYRDLDILVIDNQPRDGSFDRLQKLFGRGSVWKNDLSEEEPVSLELRTGSHPRVSLWNTGTNLGYAGGMNFGARKASQVGNPGYFLFLNNDTTLDPDCIQHLVEAGEWLGGQNIYVPVAYFPRPQVVFCGGLQSYIPGPFQFKYMGWPAVPHSQPYITPYLSGAGFLVSRDLFTKHGELDESWFLYGEDIFFGEKVRRSGGSLYMVPTAHFKHAGSKSTGNLEGPKLYYLSRNILRMVEQISGNSLFHQAAAALYLASRILLALVTFRFKTIRLILTGIRDYQHGVIGINHDVFHQTG